MRGESGSGIVAVDDGGAFGVGRGEEGNAEEEEGGEWGSA